VDGAVEKFGRIDILVNNAGGLIKTAPVAGLADEDWDYAVKWNLYSAFWASRKALGYMIPQESGRIINISSVEGKHGKPAIPAYVTCKHALIGLTKAIAKENGTSGITCNAICPGLVWTDVLVATGPDSAREMGLTFEQMVDVFAQETALKRISTVEEVAAVAVLLASDVAAGITGSAYNVDGGTAAY
jgi:3-hydroxybutyrate dehydrogenase